MLEPPIIKHSADSSSVHRLIDSSTLLLFHHVPGHFHINKLPILLLSIDSLYNTMTYGRFLKAFLFAGCKVQVNFAPVTPGKAV